MPQFDTFIFNSSLFYFILSFFIILYFNYNLILPRISSLLKLRYKLQRRQSVTKVYTTALKTTLNSFSQFIA